jgi:hypothetical protein
MLACTDSRLVQASGPGEIVTMDIYISADFIVDDDFDLPL